MKDTLQNVVGYLANELADYDSVVLSDNEVNFIWEDGTPVTLKIKVG